MALNTQAITNPEFKLEADRLEHCTASLEMQISQRQQEVPDGGDDWANQSLLAYQAERVQSLGTALEQPYFGRLDFREDHAEAVEEFYIGKVGFDADGVQVIDWRTPFASLFYTQPRYSMSYKAARRTISGQLFLKRHLEIALSQLKNITDEFDRRQVAQSDIPEEADVTLLIDLDDYLRLVLEGKKGQRLQDVVATIQEKQNDLIRAEPDQILIVQGVAGSGKTTVALHRIAYLLFPQEGTLSFKPERMLIVGSNAVFLGFISQVLPGLGITNIAQTTFAGWAAARIDPRGKLSVPDTTLAQILDQQIPHQERTRLYLQSRLKGSLKIRTVLDSCTQNYRAAHIFPKEGFSFTPVGEGSLELTYQVASSVVQQTFEDTRNLPVNQQRRQITNSIVETIMADHRQRYRAAGTEFSRRIRNNEGSQEEQQYWRTLVRPYNREASALFSLQTEISEMVAAEIEQRWPTQTAILIYRKLLTDRSYLKQMASKLLSGDEQAHLFQPAFHGLTNLRLEDLAPLLYLHLLLEGDQGAERLYDHIVVDEAQDLAPLQIWLLRQYMANGSMTILGDFAQSIHSYRGISRWQEMIDVFPDDKVQYEEMTRSYRATYEIMSFANQVINSLNLRSKLAYHHSDPFPRHGPEVRYEKVASQQTLILGISEQVELLRNGRFLNVAVICKSPDECREIHALISKQGLSLDLITNMDQPYSGGFVVLPVHLTKGVEFEACIIANANAVQFTDTELDGRLLYVAMTRALHSLSVFCIDSSSPHLPAL